MYSAAPIHYHGSSNYSPAVYHQYPTAVATTVGMSGPNGIHAYSPDTAGYYSRYSTPYSVAPPPAPQYYSSHPVHAPPPNDHNVPTHMPVMVSAPAAENYQQSQRSSFSGSTQPRSIYSPPGHFQLAPPSSTSSSPTGPLGRSGSDNHSSPIVATAVPSGPPPPPQYYQLYEPRGNRASLPTAIPIHANKSFSPTVSPLSSPMPPSSSTVPAPDYSSQAFNQDQSQPQSQKFTHTLPPLSYVLSASNSNPSAIHQHQQQQQQQHQQQQYAFHSRNNALNGHGGSVPGRVSPAYELMGNRSRNSSNSSTSDASQLDGSMTGFGSRRIKPKRKRATHQQVDKLNKVFEHTFFPSSELRMNLASELGMTPRTVQIWFQNKRQGWRSEHNRSVPKDTSMKPLKLEDILSEKSDREGDESAEDY